MHCRLAPTYEIRRPLMAMGGKTADRRAIELPFQRRALGATVEQAPYTLNRPQAVRRSTWAFMPPA